MQGSRYCRTFSHLKVYNPLSLLEGDRYDADQHGGQYESTEDDNDEEVRGSPPAHSVGLGAWHTESLEPWGRWGG